jgi:hypothetical protein
MQFVHVLANGDLKSFFDVGALDGFVFFHAIPDLLDTGRPAPQKRAALTACAVKERKIQMCSSGLMFSIWRRPVTRRRTVRWSKPTQNGALN